MAGARAHAWAVALLGDAAGRPLSFVVESPEQHVEWLRAAGTPEGYITWRMAMLRGIRSGDDAYLSDGVPRVLGGPRPRSPSGRDERSRSADPRQSVRPRQNP